MNGTIYSGLKLFLFPDRLAAFKAGKLPAPVHVRIKPTNLCNHNCWYCAYRNDSLALGDEMIERNSIPEDKMFEIVDDLIAMDVRAVTFSGGGEPLLYKPLPRVIERLAAGGIRVAALTNGANLKGAMADTLAVHATWVRISLDAWDDKSYQASRGIRGGAFSQLLRNISAFRERGDSCVLGASMIVGVDNAAHLYDVCAKLKKSGIAHVKISGVVVGNDAAANNGYHAPIRAVVTEEIARIRAELEDGTFSIFDHYHELEERFAKSYRICPSLAFLTVIGADLNVYTCQDKAYTSAGRLGSIRECRFADLWGSAETRAKVFSFDPSRACPHHCVSHRKNLAALDFLSLDEEHGYFV